MSTPVSKSSTTVLSTGTPGLDHILNGGLAADRLYLVEGAPGSGKTTLSIRFLIEGRDRGERVLYFALSESKAEVEAASQSHGWSMEGIDVVEISVNQGAASSNEPYTMFHPAEVELSEIAKLVMTEIEKRNPQRVVLDSLSELQMLAQSPLVYRRQILALKQFLTGRNCTVMVLDDIGLESDLQVESIAHGVVVLEQLVPVYGSSRRRMRVTKMRARPFRGGYHDFKIVMGGLDVFPRLVALEHREEFTPRVVGSGVAELDGLLGGGLDNGTTTLIMGPAGSGKTSLSTKYVLEATRRGEHCAMFIFDENRNTVIKRSEGMGMPLQPAIDSGLLKLVQVDPGELTPGELGMRVRESVEVDHCSIVVIDSLNGYLNSMPSENFMGIQLHEMLMYLGAQGVLTFLIVAQQGIMGPAMQTPVDASYLADTVILTRYYEFQGQIERAISVIKKRTGNHEKSIRQLRLSQNGIDVGKALSSLEGIFSGIPHEIRGNGS